MDDNREAYYDSIVRSQRGAARQQFAGMGRSAVGESISQCLRAEGTSVGHTFILCAEPGMGKTSAISYVLNSLESKTNRVRYIDLSSSTPANATSRMVKGCRDIARSKKPDNIVVIAFDGVPASDESDVQKQARAMRKLAQAGCNVIVSLLPEAEPLLDELPDALCYRSRDFLITKYVADNGFGMQDEIIASFTHGIPRLVRAARFASDSSVSRLAEDGRYLAGLSRVVGESVRHSLIDEELELRLAMLELGSGSINDIEQVLGRVDPSLIEAVAEDAPLFGLDLAAGTFSCAGIGTLEGFRGCLQALERAGSGFEGVADAVCALLTSRGDYLRAGTAMLLCDVETRMGIVLDHAAEFVDAGCRGTVEDCVRLAAENDYTDGIAEPRLVISCVVDSGHDYEELRGQAGPKPSSTTTALLLAARDALAGHPVPAELLEGRERTGLSKSLRTFLYSLGLLRDFRFADAFSYLLGAPERLAGPSVSSCLLWIEYQLATYLSGSTPTPEDSQGFRRAAYFAAGSGVPFLSLAFSAVGPIASVLMGRSSHEPLLETCIQRSAYMGNDLMQSACLMVAAIADQRVGSGARAYVRLQRAMELASLPEAQTLSSACHLLCCAAKSTLGERVVASEVLDREMSPDLAMVARALAAVIDRSQGVRLGLMGETREDECPEGTIWLVNALSNDFGAVSSRFRNVIPRSWTEQVERISDSVGELLARDHDAALPPADPSIQGEPYEVQVSLLGGFHVSVNGIPVPESHLERRRAKSLLSLLGSVQGHCVRRYEVMETVWPEFDFHDARQRVYEATSVLRGELTTKLGMTDVDPLLSNRGASTIALNPECTHCDVDDFERMAKDALGEPKVRAQEVLSLAARIEETYHGDLFVPAVDGAGLIEQRRRELRELHADVMVLASNRALALGRASLATHYAKVACASDPLREDAEIALVKALGMSGRRMDAERSYREFAERIVTGMKRPPSRELRAAYQDVMDGAEGRQAHVEDASFDEGNPAAREDSERTA